MKKEELLDSFKDLQNKHNGLVDYAKEVNQRLEDLLLLYNKQQIDINEIKQTQKEIKQIQREKDWYKNQYNNLLRDYDYLLKVTSKKTIFKKMFGGQL